MACIVTNAAAVSGVACPWWACISVSCGASVVETNVSVPSNPSALFNFLEEYSLFLNRSFAA
jgi:hypothetical protein